MFITLKRQNEEEAKASSCDHEEQVSQQEVPDVVTPGIPTYYLLTFPGLPFSGYIYKVFFVFSHKIKFLLLKVLRNMCHKMYE